MVTCKEISKNLMEYANKIVKVKGDVKTIKVLPNGSWLRLTDETGSILLWAPTKLDGYFEIDGQVYQNYIVVGEYTKAIPPTVMVPAPEEKISVTLQTVTAFSIVALLSLAAGFGIYSLTLSVPPAAKTTVTYMVPFVTMFLGMISLVVLKWLNSSIAEEYDIELSPEFPRNLWKLYLPMLVTAFIVIVLSPIEIQQKITESEILEVRNLFLLSLTPVLLSFAYHFRTTRKFAGQGQAFVFALTVLVILIPLLVAYYVVNTNLLAIVTSS